MGCASSIASELHRCGSERLGRAAEGFERPITLSELAGAIGDMAGMPAAELYAAPVSGPSLRSQVTELEQAAEDGAELWVFEGPWPSWEGIAAVQGCDVVATATVLHH